MDLNVAYSDLCGGVNAYLLPRMRALFPIFQILGMDIGQVRPPPADAAAAAMPALPVTVSRGLRLSGHAADTVTVTVTGARTEPPGRRAAGARRRPARPAECHERPGGLIQNRFSESPPPSGLAIRQEARPRHAGGRMSGPGRPWSPGLTPGGTDCDRD